jgi:aspartate/methionine/tyrosine aminotransferase
LPIPPFALERYFAEHEFSTRYLLSCSDCEALSMVDLLDMADADTRRLWDELKLSYTETPGHPLLREAVAGLYGDGIDPDNVLVVIPEEGIFLLMHALLKPGDHVVCTFPGYQSLHEVARWLGCEVSYWEPDESEGWRFDPRKLAELLRPDTRLVVTNFPHNPTGRLPARSDFDAVIDLVRQQGTYLLSDEMYRLLELEGDATLPAACEVYDRAVSLFGLSKSFGLPGLRIGWLASRSRDLLRQVSQLKDYTTICASAPSEILAIMALRSCDTIVARHRRRLERNLAVMDAFFDDHSGQFDWQRPNGGSVCFPRLTMATGAEALCRDLVKSAGIMLVPSSVFGYGDRHVRIGFGRRDLPQALERFADYLKQHQPVPTS